MNYNGGKNGSGVYQTIINHIPKHKIYIEGFMGSGAILRYKKPAFINIGIEINKLVIDRFVFTAEHRSTYKNQNPLGSCIVINDCAVHQIKKLFRKTQHLHLCQIDIDDYAAGYDPKDVFIYLDPPYLKTSRRSQRNLYANEFGTEQDHVELLKLITRLPCNVAISAYENNLYNKFLSTWSKISFVNPTHTGAAIESLYMNYKIPTELHDYSYLGEDFTERQRIKRKINRWKNRLLTLKPQERNALIESITI